MIDIDTRNEFGHSQNLASFSRCGDLTEVGTRHALAQTVKLWTLHLSPRRVKVKRSPNGMSRITATFYTFCPGPGSAAVWGIAQRVLRRGLKAAVLNHFATARAE